MGTNRDEKSSVPGTAGGGEFSEGGSTPGRSSTGSGTETGNKRYSIDCAKAGGGCSLKLSGTYDEVLAAGVEHGRSAHGMSGDDTSMREGIKGYIEEETGDSETGYSGPPGSFQGRGDSQSGVSNGPPA